MKTKSILITILAIFLTVASANQTKAPKKVLFVVTSHSSLGDTGKKTGYWLSEVSHPLSELTKAGYEVDFVSPKGGKSPVDPSSVDKKDPINVKFLENKKYQDKLNHTLRPSEVNSKDYVAIFYAGGHGTMWDFPSDKALQKITADIYENDGVVSSVCHGPSGLVNVKLSNGKYLIDGKNLSGFTNEEESAIKQTKVVPFSLENRLKEHGAKINKSRLWQEKITVDGNLITGQNPQSALAVGKAIVKKLNNLTKTTKDKKMQNIPEAILAYQKATNSKDIEAYINIFADNAEMVDVDRVFKGKSDIKKWALREVIPHGETFKFLSIVEQKRGYAQTIVHWMTWDAYYYFWWNDKGEIVKMSLQYKD